jgi:hypothetical protein
MSIVQAHIDNHTYQINDRIICYFAFPRIGVSVALQPGDFLLLNPSEPHCVSSCCTADDDIYVNPQMETNSVLKWGVPVWEYLSLPAHFRTGITIWKR